MASRVEQIIDEMEDYIDSCKSQAFSSGTKKIVVKEEMDNFINDLRLKTPEEIKRYQKIISNREAILKKAKENAESIINDAEEKSKNLVEEHEITQKAYKQATEIVDKASKKADDILSKATLEANDMKKGALDYSNEVLQNVENLLTHALDEFIIRDDGLINSLKDSLEVVKGNRVELNNLNYQINND